MGRGVRLHEIFRKHLSRHREWLEYLISMEPHPQRHELPAHVLALESLGRAGEYQLLSKAAAPSNCQAKFTESDPTTYFIDINGRRNISRNLPLFLRPLLAAWARIRLQNEV